MMDCSVSVSLTRARLVLSLRCPEPVEGSKGRSMPALPKTRQNKFDRLLASPRIITQPIENIKLCVFAPLCLPYGISKKDCAKHKFI